MKGCPSRYHVHHLYNTYMVHNMVNIHIPAKPYNHLSLSMSLIVVFWYARTRVVVRDVFYRNR